MVTTLRQLVTVEPGGVIRVQSDFFREGDLAEVLVTTTAPKEQSVEVSGPSGNWKSFIGAGIETGRTVAEIDASIRELRDEWS